ncbi:MAG: hypothetical protein Unbinned6437contig1000_38 [Prokaryotic dsDNA virus sp.]|nr:MAG: hypothetical protein Unbinned6437contig1000_38 [Prokaryotic dsDNA virus sp.]|tara:strand:+ start:19958 stop:20422 length:465 start_codon:yes stop_codon:yes gene_type:complete
MSNEIEKIAKWFSDAKPNPTLEDTATQYGCHLEEFAEGLQVTGDDSARELVSCIGDNYKKHIGIYMGDFTLTLHREESKIELLDAFCDQIVTAVGTAQYMGFDIVGALNEVIASNDSKRMPDGSFPLDKNGKITKESPNFFQPSLSKFIGTNNE